MNNHTEDTEPKEGRFVRFGTSMDGWLIDHAKDNEFKSVPELIRHIVRQYKREHSQRSTNPMKLVACKKKGGN